ncbi:MAG: BON domain-containing protein [Candidatus Korobacteraceae bacterium]
MRNTQLIVLLLGLSMAAFAQQAAQPDSTSTTSTGAGSAAITVSGPVVADYGKQVGGGNSVEDKIAKEVRHQLLMLPYYSLFDDLGYSVQGRTVTLTGVLTSQDAITKNDAEGAVKRIEGVEKVINNIEVLPPSPADDAVRRRTYEKLIHTGALSRYFWEAAPSIHIIVKNQRVTLAGFVMNEMDKNMAGIAAKTVPGVFEVTNNLRVVKG